jgi:hypothetical protein
MIKSSYLYEKTGVFQHLYILENFMMNFDSFMFCIGYRKPCRRKTQVRGKAKKEEEENKETQLQRNKVCLLSLFFLYFFFYFSFTYFFLLFIRVFTYLDLGFLPADRIRERRNDDAGKQRGQQELRGVFVTRVGATIILAEDNPWDCRGD